MEKETKYIYDEYNRLIKENVELRNQYNKLKGNMDLLHVLLKKIENVHDMKLITDHIKDTLIKFTNVTHLSIFVRTLKKGMSLTSTTIPRLQSKSMIDDMFISILSSVRDMVIINTKEEIFLEKRGIGIEETLIIPCYSKKNEIIAYLMLESDKKGFFNDVYFNTYRTLAYIVTMMIEIVLTYDAIKERMYTDVLVNAYNREYMNVLINEVLIERGTIKTDFIMTMFDIDKFKYVNDTFGHGVGDQVLKSVANYVKMNIRSDDILIRLGGDEFLIFHMNATDGNAIFNKVSKMRSEINQLKMYNDSNEEFFISGSFGVINPKLVEGPYVFDNLYKLVDDMLYKSKQNGRNLVSYFKEIKVENDGTKNIIFDQK